MWRPLGVQHVFTVSRTRFRALRRSWRSTPLCETTSRALARWLARRRGGRCGRATRAGSGRFVRLRRGSGRVRVYSSSLTCRRCIVTRLWYSPSSVKPSLHQRRPTYRRRSTRGAMASDPAGIGCVYTAQGFEYDWNGVIIGPELVWRDGRFVSNRAASRTPTSGTGTPSGPPIRCARTQRPQGAVHPRDGRHSHLLD